MKISHILEAVNTPNWVVFKLNDRFRIVSSSRVAALNATDAVLKFEGIDLDRLGPTEKGEHHEVATRRKELLAGISQGGEGFTIELPEGGGYLVHHLN
jgi:hypothetical protein